MATATPTRKVIASSIAALAATFVVGLVRRGSGTDVLQDVVLAVLIALITGTTGYLVRPAVRDTVAFR